MTVEDAMRESEVRADLAELISSAAGVEPQRITDDAQLEGTSASTR